MRTMPIQVRESLAGEHRLLANISCRRTLLAARVVCPAHIDVRVLGVVPAGDAAAGTDPTRLHEQLDVDQTRKSTELFIKTVTSG